MRDLGSFGREPAPLDPEPLLQAILAFVRARTWSESRRVVEERPELLSDAADALLGLLIAAQEDADVRRYLEEHRALLRRCREVGVERAFREKMEALARSLSAAPSEEEIRHHPLYRLAEMVLRGELTLEAARQRAIAPDTLRALDDRSIDRMDDYIIALSRDPARPIGTRIRAYVLAELNHAAAQALPASPPIRAYTANTLGNCIDDYPFKTPAHLERRVEAYREALAIWQQEGDPRRVAMTQNNLGNAYGRLAEVRDREGNLERAIAAYREALTVYTPETAPLEYAATQNNLGSAYQDLAAVRDREGNLERAIAAYREALTVYTPETAPLEYAATQNNLGSAYQDLAAVRDREGNLERAIAAYREALTVYTPETAPLEYAMTQNNLGNAYVRLAEVRDREGNLERAIAAYREALGMIDRFFVTASVAAQLGLQEAWSGLYARAVEACHRAGQPAL
ncbi:tetratricopeptide repeat protein, partial [Thermoflexus sp.]|uniref:tetratricopeptide repeat protein n=1 Tax=Thermoflexus sp. TaxID=1969742 RepID=UPI0026055B43